MAVVFIIAAMWISTAAAVSIAIMETHSAWPLLAFLIPANMKTSSDDKDNN